MIRRYIYDPEQDRVIEVAGPGHIGASAGQRYAAVESEYRGTPQTLRESIGQRLREAALDRADRRAFAHKRFGAESRWSEV